MLSPIINKEIKSESMTFGKHKITLKCLKQVKGHDDSLPFTAKLYVNNKVCCECYNDGWGGSAMLTIINEELFKVIDEEVTKYDISFNNKVFGKYTLSDVADELAWIIVDNKKIWKTIRENEFYNLIFSNEISIIQRHWVNRLTKFKTPIHILLENESMVNTLSKVIKEMADKGYKLLNTNVPNEIIVKV